MTESIRKFTGHRLGVLAGLMLAVQAFSLTIEAAVDLSLQGVTRTYPIGGLVEVEAGLSRIFWGDAGRATGGSSGAGGVSPWYGYARAFVGGGGAGMYTETTAGVEVFPVAFLGARLKSTWFENHDDYDDYDCAAADCRGEFQDKVTEGVLKLGVRRLFFLGTFAAGESRRRDLSEVGQYVHPGLALELDDSGANKFERIRGLLGFRISDTVFVSAIYDRYELDDLVSDADDKNTVSELLTGNIHWKPGGFHIFVGAGEFHSDLIPRDPTVVAGMSWEFVTGPGL